MRQKNRLFTFIVIEEETFFNPLPEGEKTSLLLRSGNTLKFNVPFFHRANGLFRERVETLGKPHPDFTIMEDVGDLPGFISYREGIKERLEFYRKNGVAGIFAFGGHSYNFQGSGFRWEMDFYIFFPSAVGQMPEMKKTFSSNSAVSFTKRGLPLWQNFTTGLQRFTGKKEEPLSFPPATGWILLFSDSSRNSLRKQYSSLFEHQ